MIGHMVWGIRKTYVGYSVGHVLRLGVVWARSGCVVGIKRWACVWRSSIIGHTVGHSADNRTYGWAYNKF